MDNELAAYRLQLRLDELTAKIADLRSELGEEDREQFEDKPGADQLLYIGADGNLSEFKRLLEYSYIEVEKWIMLKMKSKMLETYAILQERLKAKNNKDNTAEDAEDLRNYGQ